MSEDLSRAAGPVGPLGEPSIADYLGLLRTGLSGSIRPELSDDRARGLLDMALTLIDHLIVRSGPNGAALAERDAALAKVRHALGGEGLEQAVADAIARRSDPAALAEIRAGLAAEDHFLHAIDALEKDAALDRAPVAQDPIDAQAIAAYLTRRYGGPVGVDSVGSPIGGFSKDVFILSLTGDARPAHRIVIRRDLPNGPLEGSVQEEFAVLQAAHAAGVPVAAPLWLEMDPALFGGPTICLGFVEGGTVADARGQIPPDKAVASFRLLARIIGAIHAIDPVAAGLLAPSDGRSVQTHILALLASFEEQWHRRREADSIVLAAGFAWMRANLPQEQYPVAIVHGDCSLRNLMVQDDQPTALLDWETWHFGDAAEDLAYVRDEVESFMPWSEFMAEYRAAGGPDISDERLHFWSIWRELRGSITSISMMDAVPKGAADIRAAFGGIYFTRLLMMKLADRLQGLLAA
nr:phosphotransferase family protein [Sphingomonas sp. CDS-1]